MSLIGPGQSDLLIHFCGRRKYAKFTPDVPYDIQAMTPVRRLESILLDGRLRAFTPFRAHTPAVCLSECPGVQLSHMLDERGLAPWGVMLRRADVIAAGGGAIAYPPDRVHREWPAEMKVWGNPIGGDGLARLDFSWEREWRIPAPDGGLSLEPRRVAAFLVGDPAWTPPRPDEWGGVPRVYWDGEALWPLP